MEQTHTTTRNVSMNPQYNNTGNTNNDDDDTVTTAASSFVHVGSTPAATGGGPPLLLSIQPRHGSIGLDAVDPNNKDGTKYVVDQVCATVRALETQEGDERAAVDILVALDVSGSMGGPKLKLCKQTLGLLVRVLQSQDRFGLVTYASEARLDIPVQRLTAQHRDKCLQVIRALTPRGCTNISAALGLAAQEMHAVESPNPVRSVFLLTDGHANEGLCGSGLVQLARNCLTPGGGSVQMQTEEEDIQVQTNAQSFMGFTLGRGRRDTTPAVAPPAEVRFTAQSQIPVTLYTFGYGVDHNEKLLQEMSDVTEGGSYYFVEDDKSVSTAFGDAMGGIVSVVAQNAVLHLTVPPAAAAMGVRIDKVYHDQAIVRENGSYTVTVGDFYAEETRDVVLDVQLAVPEKTAMDSPIPHVSARLCYTDTLQRRPMESAPVTASISRPTGTNLSAENDHVAAQWLRVFSVQQMEHAEALAAAYDFDAAQVSLGTVRTAYHQQSPSVQAHGESAGVYQSSLGMMQDLSSAHAYSTTGSKRARQVMFSHRKQRFSAMTPRAYPTPGSATGAAAATVPPGGSSSTTTTTALPYETKSKKAWRTTFG